MSPARARARVQRKGSRDARHAPQGNAGTTERGARVQRRDTPPPPVRSLRARAETHCTKLTARDAPPPPLLIARSEVTSRIVARVFASITRTNSDGKLSVRDLRQ